MCLGRITKYVSVSAALQALALCSLEKTVVSVHPFFVSFLVTSESTLSLTSNPHRNRVSKQ